MISDMDAGGLIGMDIPDYDMGFIIDGDDFSNQDIDELMQCQTLLQFSDTPITDNEHFLNFIALNRLHIDSYGNDRQEQIEQNHLAREYYRKLKPAGQQKLVAEFTECIRSFISEMDIPDDVENDE